MSLDISLNNSITGIDLITSGSLLDHNSPLTTWANNCLTNPDITLEKCKVTALFEIVNPTTKTSTYVNKNGLNVTLVENVKTLEFSKTNSYAEECDPRSFPSDPQEHYNFCLTKLRDQLVERQEKISEIESCMSLIEDEELQDEYNELQDECKELQKMIEGVLSGSQKEVDALINIPTVSSDVKEDLIEWGNQVKQELIEHPGTTDYTTDFKVKEFVVEMIFKTLSDGKKSQESITWENPKLVLIEDSSL
jgi:hypothetical protein